MGVFTDVWDALKGKKPVTSFEDRKAITLQHLEHPEVGDLFHEMWSFYVVVTALPSSGGVEVVEFSPGDHGTTMEAELKTKSRKLYPSVPAFTREYCYASRPGAWSCMMETTLRW